MVKKNPADQCPYEFELELQQHVPRCDRNAIRTVFFSLRLSKILNAVSSIYTEHLRLSLVKNAFFV